MNDSIQCFIVSGGKKKKTNPATKQPSVCVCMRERERTREGAIGVMYLLPP